MEILFIGRNPASRAASAFALLKGMPWAPVSDWKSLLDWAEVSTDSHVVPVYKTVPLFGNRKKHFRKLEEMDKWRGEFGFPEVRKCNVSKEKHKIPKKYLKRLREIYEKDYELFKY